MSDVYLGSEAPASDRWDALRLNVEACYERSALARPAHRAYRPGQLLLTTEHAVIPSQDAVQSDNQIDDMMEWYRNLPETAAPIIWFVNAAAPPLQLCARMLARGASPNWEPHWMWCELDELTCPPPHQTVDIHTVEPHEELTPPRDEDVATKALAQAVPRRIWHVIADTNGKRVGGCFVNVTTGPHGVAGLFDMWVDEEHQRQGIGSALLSASVRLSKDLGCHHMYLNSTPAGESVYQKGGFRSMAHGTTWFLRRGFDDTKPPEETMIRFLEALLQGDVSRLDELATSGVTRDQMQAPTVNGSTPLEMAVKFKLHASADWLVARGVVPDVISLWDLGWKDRLRELLQDRPALVNDKYGDSGETPLHTAVARDDVDLARLLLDVPTVDLGVTDDCYHATPLGWADVLGAEKVLPLLKQKREMRRSDEQI